MVGTELAVVVCWYYVGRWRRKTEYGGVELRLKTVLRVRRLTRPFCLSFWHVIDRFCEVVAESIQP